MRITLSANKELVAEVRAKLTANGRHCPNQPISDNTVCICKEFQDMETGVCRCGLYTKTKD